MAASAPRARWFSFGAALRGGLELGSAKIDNAHGVALNAGRTTVETGIYATGGFVARGEVQLDGAHILGSVNLADASLTNSGGTALLADRLDVQGQFYCGHGFTAQGSIRLAGASIGAGMYFNGSRLSSSAGPALLAWGLTVGGIVNCCDGFTADRLHLYFHQRPHRKRAMFRSRHHQRRPGTQPAARRGAADRLRYRHCHLDLRHAFVEVLRDDPAGWPHAARLDGFTYTTVVSPLPAAAGSAGLLATPTATTRSLMSNSRRHIARCRGTTLTPAPSCSPSTAAGTGITLSAPLQAWGHIQDWMVGYGYRPQRAALWLSALLIVGTIAFAARHPQPLAPRTGAGIQPGALHHRSPAAHRSFRSEGRVRSTRLATLAGGRPDRRRMDPGHYNCCWNHTRAFPEMKSVRS